MTKAVFQIDEQGSAVIFHEYTAQQAAKRDPWANTPAQRDDTRKHNDNHDGTIEWSDPNFWGR